MRVLRVMRHVVLPCAHTLKACRRVRRRAQERREEALCQPVSLIGQREEVFTQPFLLDRKDSWEEADDCWQPVYQWLSDVVVFPLPEGGSGSPDSEEEDHTP